MCFHPNIGELVDAISFLYTVFSNRFALLAIPLVLTSFTHLWNPIGFPDLFYDEGVYLRRAMHVLDGLGPQESPYYYDHPFFGQLFLAGIFKLLNFPEFMEDGDLTDIRSVDSLYLVPRLLMGVLAIIDTFLVYKIAEKKYGTNVALVASVLFSVMPITWIFRLVVLDSILVPFLLSSILLALDASGTNNRKYALTLMSGICFGLAMFVKVPVFAMIPLLWYLVTQSQNESLRQRRYKLLLWFSPVILIPLLWPIESMLSGHFDSWVDTVIWQAERGNRGVGLLWISGIFVVMDPLLFALSIAGGIYAMFKRNWLILLWELPFIMFLALIGQTNYFHWASLMPVFCIASSLFLVKGLPQLLASIRMLSAKITPITIFSVSILGLCFTTIVVSLDVSMSQRQALSFAISYIEDNKSGNMNKITIISSPVYSWIFKYVYRADNSLNDFRDVIFDPIRTPEWLLIADQHFRSEMQVEPKLLQLYGQREIITVLNSYPLSGLESVSYPYTNLLPTMEGCNVEIATKGHDQETLSQDTGSAQRDYLLDCNRTLSRLQNQYAVR